MLKDAMPAIQGKLALLNKPADLSQAHVFYHLGDVTIPDAKPQPLIVNGLLQGYGGVTYDKLIHQRGKSKLSLQMASFCLLPIGNSQSWLLMGFNKISHTAICTLQTLPP